MEKAAGKLAGVAKASVNLATEKMSIQYDEAQLNEEDIKQAVSAAGFQAVSQAVQRTFAIEGMSCASCAQTIEKAVNHLAGVDQASVNLATEKMMVQYSPDVLNSSEISAAVDAAGFKAIEETDEVESTDKDQEKKTKAYSKHVAPVLVVGSVYCSAIIYCDGPYDWVAFTGSN